MKINNIAKNPLFICGYRPFFFVTAVGAVAGVALWVLALVGALGAYQPAGGWLVWHVHTLVVGVALASVAGFMLTAVLEFTGCAPLPRATLQRLFAAWLLARVAHLASGLWPSGLVLTMVLADAWVLGRLLVFVAPPIWRETHRRHIAFIPALLALGATHIGAGHGLWTQGDVLRWTGLATHALMALIVVALSRVSTRIVNDTLTSQGHGDVAYMARPPRRNLAVFCVAAYAAVNAAWPQSSTAGWLALGAAAAVFNLLNDWHVRTALRSRWVWPLYAVYVFMGLGYLTLGLAHLWGVAGTNLGHHLLLVGALGLVQWMVMVIASFLHSGHALPTGRWVPTGATLLVAAALVRGAAAWPDWSAWATHGWVLATLAWTAAWGLYLVFGWHTLWQPRPDGLEGCEEGMAASCDTHSRHA